MGIFNGYLKSKIWAIRGKGFNTCTDALNADLKFVSNIHGDAINHYGGFRSIWMDKNANRFFCREVHNPKNYNYFVVKDLKDGKLMFATCLWSVEDFKEGFKHKWEFIKECKTYEEASAFCYQNNWGK